MKTRVHALSAFLLVALCACASLGINADTFNKRVVLANSIVESTAQTIETLVTAEKISKPEAQKYLDQTKEAAFGIDAAKQIYRTDPNAADTKLGQVIAGLNALNSVLERRSAK